MLYKYVCVCVCVERANYHVLNLYSEVKSKGLCKYVTLSGIFMDYT